MRLCQKNIPLNSRPRLSSDTKRENPFNRSVRNCISRKAHSTTGEENTVPSKQQIVPTRQKSSTPFQGGWKSWSMNGRSFGSLGTYQMCPYRKTGLLGNLYQKPDNPYSVYELCEALDVARGTFYNHIFRRADRSKRDQEQARLMRLVQQVFDDSAQRFGAEKFASL